MADGDWSPAAYRDPLLARKVAEIEDANEYLNYDIIGDNSGEGWRVGRFDV